MALIGGQINPALYPQPDYRNVIEADRMRAQSFIDVGASIGNVIKDFSEAKKESKKVDADNKASVKAIEAAITLGGSYGITGAENTLRPFLEAYNDPNLSPIEKAALLDEGKKMIPNVFGRFDASQADAIQRAQLNARNAPQPVPLDFKPVDIAMVVNGVKGTKRVLEDANTGRIRTSDGKEYRNIEDAKAGRNPINQGYNDTQIGIDNALSMPSSSGEYDPTAASVLLGGDYPDGVVSIGSPAPLGAATTTEIPQVDGPPITNVPKTPLNKESIPNLPNDFIPDDAKESYRPFTPEEITRYGSDGQVSSTGKVYPIRPSTGGRITRFNPETGQLEIIEGSQAGGKAEGVAKAQEQMKGESFRLNQSNTEEAFKRLDTAGTNNPVFAAGNALLAEALPASETGELAGFYERINSENSFIKMSQLRASSPTGGAAGTMTEKEWPRFEGRFSPLKVNARKNTIAKSLSLNLLNAFEATNGTPNDIIKALDEKRIDQATYDNYVSDYVRNRQIARVNANGVEGESNNWTKLNKKLLSKSTIFEAPTNSGIELLPDEQQLIDKHKTK